MTGPLRPPFLVETSANKEHIVHHQNKVPLKRPRCSRKKNLNSASHRRQKCLYSPTLHSSTYVNFTCITCIAIPPTWSITWSRLCLCSARGGPWCLTLAPGQLKNLSFFHRNHMLSKLDFTCKFRAQIFPQFFLEQSLAGISVIIIIIITNNNNLLFARLQITFKYDLMCTNKNKIYKIIRINLSI